MTHDSGGRQSELQTDDKNVSVGTKKEPTCNICRVINATQSETLSKSVAEIHSAMGNCLLSTRKNIPESSVHANVYHLSLGFTVLGLFTQYNFCAQQN